MADDTMLRRRLEELIVPIMDGYYGPALDQVVTDVIAAVRQADTTEASLLRRLTHVDGDGTVRTSLQANTRLDVILPSRLYQHLRWLHPPLDQEDTL